MNKLDFFQERDFGGRISLVFSFIKQNYKILFTGGVYLLPAVILINLMAIPLLSGLITLLYTLYIGVYAMEYTLSDNPQSITLNDIWSKILKVFPYVLGGYFLYLFVTIIYFGSIAGLILSFSTNKDLDTLMLLARLFYLNPLAAGLVTLSFVLIMIPFIWASVTVALFIQAYLYSNNGIINAFKESYRLVKGKWWLSFGFIVVSFFVAYLFASIPLCIFSALGEISPLSLQYVTAILATTVLFFTIPIITIALHVLYTDLKEGKDGVKVHLQHNYN